MKLSKFITILSGLFILISCGPSRYMMDVETRQVSRSGVDLVGKNISVIYGQNGQLREDTFLEGMAEGFSQALGQKYQDSVGDINLCSLKSASEYANRDSLLNLLIETGADVVFLFDTLACRSQTTYSFILKCYDGMNANDRVQLFSGSFVARNKEVGDALKKEAVDAGEDVATAFEPQWKPELFSIYYYDNTKWYTAIEKSAQFDWKGAMDIWISLIKTKDSKKRACLSYNIATACYMLGQYELASEWLDRADNDAELLVSNGLRQRINSFLPDRK